MSNNKRKFQKIPVLRQTFSVRLSEQGEKSSDISVAFEGR